MSRTTIGFCLLGKMLLTVLVAFPSLSLSQDISREYTVGGMPGRRSGEDATPKRTASENRIPSPARSKPAVSPLRIASTYAVTNTNDNGTGSLRRAIDSANTNPGLDVITFNIPGGGPQTISLLSALPTITGPVILDGWTQPGFSGTPIIEVSGLSAGTNINGLVLTGGNSTVRGLVINRFPGAGGNNGFGIVLDVNGGNVIEGNYIGTDVAGAAILRNTGDGIGIFGASSGNRIGGNTPQERNLLSGNNTGVSDAGTGGNNAMRGNYIGVNAAGTAVLGNSADGIYLNAPNDTVGGVVAGAANVVSGNYYPGIFIDLSADGTVVQGNFIGTNAAGTTSLGNLQNGIMVNGSQHNIIGSASVAGRNIVSGNGLPGIYLYNSIGDTIQGNYVGLNAAGSARLPNAADGLTIEMSGNNAIGGLTAGSRNVISGNSSPGIRLLGAFATGNTIQGNYIGINAAGTDTLGNGNGIVIDGAPGNTIGGTSVGARNIISGNYFPGLFITNAGATGNRVINNYIGTNVGGSAAFPNTKGIVIDNAPGNIIGGVTTAEGNVVSGNAGFGIEIRNAGATGNRIAENFIGTDYTGTSNIGNGSYGIVLNASLDSVIDNTIAYNRGNGVFDSTGSQNPILGNTIFSNNGLGIDFSPHGLARNDSLDVDTGPNQYQNFPLLDSATVSGDVITVHGRLNSKPNSPFQIEFFQNVHPDPSHFGEGEIPLFPRAVVLTDNGGNVRFDASVTIPVLNGGDFITATATDEVGNTSEFSQALCLSDSDGDGLLDSWETPGWGIDVNSDSTIDLDLHALGARPDSKDIFIEVDAMTGMAPLDSLQGVQDAFAIVPNSMIHNPNGATGIDLHITISDTTIPLAPWPTNYWASFDSVKNAYFGTAAERNSPNARFILEAKKLVYRYCVFAYQHTTQTWSGRTEPGFLQGANDFMVTLGAWTPSGGTADQKAGTFMHELGHSLGLDHGGADAKNYKPNYVSIMNYTWQMPFKWTNTWRLDYSREPLPSLNEASLDESLGLNPPLDFPYMDIAVPYSGPHRGIMYARLRPNATADWDSSGAVDSVTFVSADLNVFDRSVPLSPGETLDSQEDWSKLIYNFRNSPAFLTAPGRNKPMVESDEMDNETFDFLNNLPPPKPRGQFVMDGQLDTSAVLLASNAGINLYARYKAGQLYVATNTAQSQGGDMFIFISDSVRSLRTAPPGKSGQVAAWSAYLTNKSSDNSAGWYGAAAAPLTNVTVDTVGTVLEGVIDLELLYARDPANVYIAVGKYGSNAGGALIAQVPLGNGDGNIDPLELYHFLGAPPSPPSAFVQQGNKLVGTGAVNGTVGVQQGCSVDLSGDGNTAIVGADADNGYAGAAWVFIRAAGVWSQQGSKLVASDAAGLARIGSSVALSSDGNTAIVGGFRDNNYVGAAWIFTRSGDAWTQQGPKLVGLEAAAFNELGWSVDISSDGNTAIVGSSGAGVWIFARSGGVWTQQGPRLTGTGAVGTSGQGISVCVSADGNTAIVGGYADNNYAGATWIFTRNGSVWSQQGSKLVGTGAVNIPYAAYQGWSVALSSDGNTALVGGIQDDTAKGAVWVFSRSGNLWGQQGNKLVGTGALGHAEQGYSVSLSADGNTGLVGAYADDGNKGATWVFTRTGTAWSQMGSKLVGTGAANSPYPALQGYSAALSSDGNTAIVGGPNDAQNLGAAWVFAHDVPLPIQLANFTATPLDGERVRLDWTTLSEINNYGFEAQRRPEDQGEFQTVPNSFVPGHGTTNEPHTYSFIDSTAQAGQWRYRLKQTDLDGTIHFGPEVTVLVTGVEETQIPMSFALQQNYPNPFNPSTTIRYELPEAAHVTLKIWNTLGQQVATLVDGVEEAGYKSVVWRGENVASGVYFYRIVATAGRTSFTDVRKMLVLK